MEIGIELQGGDELTEKLGAVTAKIKDASTVSLIARAAYAVQRQAQLNATGRPGPNVQTGRLRASIATEILNWDRARVGTDVFYAPFVEFGHIQHPGQFVPPLGLRLVKDFCPAYPFLYPSIEQCNEELQGICVTFGNELKSEFTT